jgi:hypothetical protein
MGWERTNGFTFGVMVKKVEAYSSYMVESYEKRSTEM